MELVYGFAVCPVSAEEQVAMKTYTYKQVRDLEIKADVYRAYDETIRPAVVWIHGGALINGHRAGVSGRVKDWALDFGTASRARTRDISLRK